MTQTQQDAIELVEVLPGKLYFIASRCDAPPPPNALVHFIDVTREFRYAGFYLDFGPLSLGHVVAFARRLDAQLRALEHATSPDARVCVYSSAAVSTDMHSPRMSPTQAYAQHCANAVCILGCWAVLSLGWSAERAFAPFKHLALPAFHDATRGADSFGLSVLHVLRGLERALQAQLFSPERFNLDEYVYYEQVAHGDLSWISPTFVAFAGPHDAPSASSSKLPPEHYVPHFRARNVALVVRLSRKRYDKTRFTRAGFAFAELYFPDGATPPDAVLHKFLELCDRTRARGAIAVHCKAGLGRTGTLIACDLMKQHRFSAEEAIAWLRLCRPGSVVGPQQHYLRGKQAQLWASSPLCLPKDLVPTSEPSETSVVKRGIAARPRRRSSLSVGGSAILKRVDQLRTGSSSASAKSSHSVSPVVSNTSSNVRALLPPRIPGPTPRTVTQTEASDIPAPLKALCETQGDLLNARKLAQQQQTVSMPPPAPVEV